MNNHVTLTEQERDEVLAFWRDYMLTGGEGEPPSFFQLDALNDECVRDTFLFWHVGGDPFSKPDGGWAGKADVAKAMAILGPHPRNTNNVVRAMTKAVNRVNDMDPSIDMIDTSTVLVLAHVMMLLLLKRFDAAGRLLADIVEINARASSRLGKPILHEGPLEAMVIVGAIVGATAAQPGNEQKVDSMLLDVFCVDSLPTLANTQN